MSTSPQKNDVLLGRGTPNYIFNGNIHFRNIIKENVDIFSSAKSNIEKKMITKDVLQRLKNQCPPGRFIRYDSKDNVWIEATNEESELKIAQAFRNMKRNLSKLSDATANINKNMMNAKIIERKHIGAEAIPAHYDMSNYNFGRWSAEEIKLFLEGLRTFGKGKWKEIGQLVTTR